MGGASAYDEAQRATTACSAPAGTAASAVGKQQEAQAQPNEIGDPVRIARRDVQAEVDEGSECQHQGKQRDAGPGKCSCYYQRPHFYT